MKKNICLIITASLILTMTACGSSASKNTADTTSATAAAADTAKGAETESAKPETTAPEKETVKETEKASDKETKDSPEPDSGKKSEAEKFMEEFRAAFKSYSEPLTDDFYTALRDHDFERARKAVEESAAGLEAMENVKVPKKYKELHAKFIETFGVERENLEYMRKYADYYEKYTVLVNKPSPTDEETGELKEFTEEMEKLNKQAEENSENAEFTSCFMDIIMSVQADIDKEKEGNDKGESEKE